MNLPKLKLSSKLRTWLSAILIGYVVVGIALYFLQEKFLFHPTPLENETVLKIDAPIEEIRLAVTGQKMLHITRFMQKDSLAKGAVLYFHGNRDNVERYAPAAELFTSEGYEVWMPEYPGFGKSTGERSEAIMKQDAELAYKMLRTRFSEDKIVIYGRSLGTGPASWLASRVEAKHLILETPYSSIPDLMAHYAFIYPVSWMAKYSFDNYQYLSQVSMPVTILHGSDDKIIPVKLAKKLATVKPAQTELVLIEGGGHNNLGEFPIFVERVRTALQ